MDHTVQCTWKDGLAFENEVQGHTFITDVSREQGGEDLGPRPKPLLLSALAGCTGIDIIMILSKMKISPKYFNVSVGAGLTEGQPSYYDTIHIKYEFHHDDKEHEKKIERAVSLSREKYCGVTAMLGKASKISHEITFDV